MRNAVVGRFTATSRYTVVHDPALAEDVVVSFDPKELPLSGEVGLNVPYSLLKDEPQPRSPTLAKRVEKKTEWPLITRNELPELLTKILSDPEIADQSFAANQYDWTVQGRGTGLETCSTRSYTALHPIYGQPYATVFSTAFNPWLFAAQPRLAARQMFLQALTAQVLAGVKLPDICLCDNFYTPHLEPGADYWLCEMVEELASLVEVFGTPLISGKDSSAGSTETAEGIISVPPAVFISALGKVPNAAKLLSNDWQSVGNALVLIGPKCRSLAGTVAQRVFATDANNVDVLEPVEHLEFLHTIAALPEGLLQSGVPIGPGGLLAAFARGSAIQRLRR